MDKKIKVTNPNNHHVGVIFMDGIERNIPPKGFVLATEDDIAYWESTTKLFKDKHLTFQDEEVAETLGLDKDTLKIDSDEEILKKLNSGTIASLRKYLESIKEFHMRQRIIDVAKKGDLKKSRFDLIEEVFATDIIN